MRLLAGIAALCALAVAAPQAAAIELHAHRGGPLANGVPVAFENSMGAFERAEGLGYVDKIEMDVKLTKDDVPVVMHDATLDRTTNCTGRVDAKTLAELRGCYIDFRGSGAVGSVVEGSTEPIPTVPEFLAWAVQEGAGVNYEIKNLPTDPDFDPTGDFARIALQALEDSGISPAKVQVQTFWPPDLDIAEAWDVEWKTSLLTLTPFNEPAVPFSLLRGYDALGPQWPPATPTYMETAQAAGKPVIPYTLNTVEQVESAVAAGVAGVITDDPERADSALP